MPDAPKVIDRGALYYPFIHVRDEEWLKATLLCFPFVDRMVPAGYEVNDSDLAGYFASAQGRFGRPMLGRRDVADKVEPHTAEINRVVHARRELRIWFDDVLRKQLIDMTSGLFNTWRCQQNSGGNGRERQTGDKRIMSSP